MRWKRGAVEAMKKRHFTGKKKLARGEDGPAAYVIPILRAVRRIPRGRVAAYADVAREAGFPKCARLVGRVLRDEPMAADVPWHRVASALGVISIPDDRSAREQARRLEAEGVRCKGRRIMRFGRVRWRKAGPQAAPQDWLTARLARLSRGRRRP